jgi:uncharacterized protein YegP (UPF0339 family)
MRPQSLFLGVAVAGLLALGSLTTAPAQPKATATKADAPGTVEIYQAKDGYRFRVKGLDGKVLAQPTKGYKTKDECQKSLDTIKAILNSATVTEVKKGG